MSRSLKMDQIIMKNIMRVVVMGSIIAVSINILMVYG